jgi:D-amino-acid oxidase
MYTPLPVSRRTVLKTLGLSSMGLLIGGCGPKPALRPPISPHLRLARVHVARDRIIRTVVGLRPFRASGFVIRSESLDEKTIIHNYGHGGGGVTLSWGTAHLAMELALETGKKQCAVLGCGAVGLATARLMQRQGWQVTIYTRELPPDTTSNIAGAQWSPSSVFDPGQTTGTFDKQFYRAMRLSYRYFQDLAGAYYGVRWVSNYILRNLPAPPGGIVRQYPDLYPETKILSTGTHPFHTAYALHYDTMFIEPPVYLNAVLRDFYLSGGKIEINTFTDRRELAALTEPVLINCTGLGARDLFNDKSLIPIKGQLTFLLPQHEVDYLLIHRGLYMFPRTDGILLGGTHERDEWSLEPDQEAINRIVLGHKEVFDQMDSPVT